MVSDECSERSERSVAKLTGQYVVEFQYVKRLRSLSNFANHHNEHQLELLVLLLLILGMPQVLVVQP